jgi:hypothetical protein
VLPSTNIVFELARHDSGGIEQDGTQFIIEDVKSDPLKPNRGFDARSKRHLRGLNQAHIDAIESFQPYRGVEWTKTLRDISNPDKHRKLTLLSSIGRSVGVVRKLNQKGRFGPAVFTIADHPSGNSVFITPTTWKWMRWKPSQ